MEKYGHAIGGIKSQMKILRERIEAVERQAERQKFRTTLLLVSVGVLFATLIIGVLLRYIIGY